MLSQRALWQWTKGKLMSGSQIRKPSNDEHVMIRFGLPLLFLDWTPPVLFSTGVSELRMAHGTPGFGNKQ
jgi:hypothetical protein